MGSTPASSAADGVAYARHAAMVRDHNRILLNVREAGDEPLMMAKSFEGPIAIGRRRIDAIALLDGYLHRQGQSLDAIVLDDGFQHLRLKRDLNLLLINTARGLGNGWLLPAGACAIAAMRSPARTR